MSPLRGVGFLRWIALATGVVLFCATLYFVDLREALINIRRLGVALPLALAFSALWHVARTWAWAWSFPRPQPIGFLELARIRLSAEAFSYLTLRGIAGEPLKVLLLAGKVDARQATAAVALERIAYLVGTTLIVGVASVVAIAWLPLTRVWFRVFRAFAIAAGVVAGLSAAAIAGRGTYLQSLLRAVDRRTGSGMATGRIGRFIGAVERQMLELVRGNPRRLAVLGCATLLSFVFMVLEAWIILQAAGSSIGVTGAFAVETFSRVASFASALIPANLGALEASSVAAAASVGAAGGASLAIARRIRGLFWAGLGLLLYPRRETLRRTTGGDSGPENGPRHALLYLPYAEDVAVPPSAILAGLPMAERVIRSALRAGCTDILVLLPDGIGCQPSIRRRISSAMRDTGARLKVARTAEEWRAALDELPGSDPVTVIGPGTVVAPAILVDALSVRLADDVAVDVPAGPDHAESGIIRAARAVARDAGSLQDGLRARRVRRQPLPSGEDASFGRARLALRITTADELFVAEQTMRRGSYKDTDAKVARFNRRMSLPISIALMRTPLTANQVSVLLVAVGLYSAWLFSLGHYLTGVLGAFLSLSASVLDGCDGEIARLKYQESALGCWIETIGDYSYYIAIFVGLTVGAVRQTGWGAFYWLGGLALSGTLVSFGLLIYLRSRITAGQPERLHSIAKARFKAEPTLWSRLVWRVSFVATRAAMPYGIMAFSLVAGLPAIVLLAAIGANVYWISLVVKLRDLLSDSPEARRFSSAS